MTQIDAKELDEWSEWIKPVGERYQFKGEVISSRYKAAETAYNNGFFINKIRCDGDLVVHFSQKAITVGDIVTFKATVSRHDEYQGIKTTVIKRPDFMVVIGKVNYGNAT